MPCSFINMPGGGSAIICGRKRVNACHYCRGIAAVQYDYPVPPQVKPCDRYTYREHAKALGDNLDYCQDHAPRYASPIQGQVAL